MSRARTLMIQGTASGVGKSLMVAAACRLLTRRGLRVAPFKAQNMALNAAVAADGGEVGRAQAVQALACGLDVTTDMNPVLLKPEGERSAQVVIRGEPTGRMDAAGYHRAKRSLWQVVAESLDRLRETADVVVIEGAGSPAEVNLRHHDIVNMRVARHARSPVVLVGDIDRGGVFAALLGTLALLTPAERSMVRALCVNNFRGDPALFSSGAAFLERRSRLAVLGPVPHVGGLRLAEEDSLGLPRLRSHAASGGAIDVAVVALPRISNFDDCDPLLLERRVSVRSVSHGDGLGDPDLVILPGSKATRADLRSLRAAHLDRALRAARAGGSALLGVCGGFQLLGASLDDPHGADGGGRGRSVGLGLLDVRTRMNGAKTIRRVRGEVLPSPGLLAGARGAPVEGYEIHAGSTAPRRPPLRLRGASGGGDPWDDGASSPDGWVVGTHVHGLLSQPRLRRALLRAVAGRRARAWRPGPPIPGPLDELDRLADAVEASVGTDRLLGLVDGGVG